MDAAVAAHSGNVRGSFVSSFCGFPGDGGLPPPLKTCLHLMTACCSIRPYLGMYGATTRGEGEVEQWAGHDSLPASMLLYIDLLTSTLPEQVSIVISIDPSIR